jgi:DNA gyrase subunit B
VAKSVDELEVTNGEDYDASKITVLEGLEAVRKRPAMYIGSTGPNGLHHCVFEVVDNSIDEALAGHCSNITSPFTSTAPARSRTTAAASRSTSTRNTRIPALELVLTNLHAGGKFGKGAYMVSGGLHGVGAKCVNAVSEWFEAEVRREGKIHHMRFEQGNPEPPNSTVIGETEKNRHQNHLQAGRRNFFRRVSLRPAGQTAA